ncbi:MAG: non-ribosomal peptide synthetase, partial [Herbaspirillum sp.]
LSYAELAAANAAVAAALSEAGMRHGQMVAIVADRGRELVCAVHGTLLAGGVYVPIDPSLPEARRHYLLANSGARHVLAQRHYAGKLAWPENVRVLVIEDCQHTGLAVAGFEQAQTDLAYLIYTSGSTGRPKGVMIEHRGALNTIVDVNTRFGVHAADVLFGVSSFSFDLSVYDLFGSALAGASLVYPEPQQALNPAHWLDRMIECDVSIWNSAPALAALLIEAAENRGVTLPHLRLVLMSGDWIPTNLPACIKRIAPHARIVSLGGTTEASIWSILFEIDEVDPAWPSIPYGYPMRNQSWFILDARLEPVPEWVAGDLYIGGVGLAQGYWQDAEKTVASFMTHPATGERIYRTGDRGRYLPGGVIEFMGRSDSQVKIHGHRVELGEIESVLLAHPDIAAAVVLAQHSGAAPQLAAHIVPSRASLDADEVRRHLARAVPEYMAPRLIGFLDRLPLSSNGKIDRKALPDLSGRQQQQATTERRQPRDAIEWQLLIIWQKVLKSTTLSVVDNFFDAGGQSFEAVRMVGLVGEELGVSLSLGDVWQHPTVAALASHLRGVSPLKQRDPLVAMRRQGSGTPLFLVHPAGGHVMCYRHLGALLQRPVFAFEAAGVDGVAVPLDSVQAMAAAYLARLDATCPQGPVLLGGWSSGGPIAYEMALQLRQRGRAVEGVVALDSPAPLMHGEVDEASLMHWFIDDLDLNQTIRTAIRALPVDHTNGERQLRQIAAALHGQGLSLGMETSQLTAIYRVFAVIVRSNRLYHAGHGDIDMLIVRARDGVVSEFSAHPFASESDWGWSQLTTGEVLGEVMPGTHYSLLSQEASVTVAALIEAWLVRATRKPRATASPAAHGSA